MLDIPLIDSELVIPGVPENLHERTREKGLCSA
jgi:hypothetical protein